MSPYGKTVQICGVSCRETRWQQGWQQNDAPGESGFLRKSRPPPYGGRCKLEGHFRASFDGRGVGVKIMHPKEVIFSQELVPPMAK